MKLHVTDHAVLRYLERHGGFDIEALRRSIEERLKPFAMTGAERASVDGMVFVFRSDPEGIAVVTVLQRLHSIPRLERRDG